MENSRNSPTLSSAWRSNSFPGAPFGWWRRRSRSLNYKMPMSKQKLMAFAKMTTMSFFRKP
jgi:hypothetical protein